MPSKHAILSASSSSRWINCPPSAQLNSTVDEKPSEYAMQGTDAHSLCEYKVKALLGMETTNPIENLSYYDDEMESCAEDYANYVFCEVEQAKLKGNGKSVPALAILKTPLRDGDLERSDDDTYANSYFINANSASAPGVVDSNCQPIIDRSEVYSGVYGRASINFYAFNSNGNKGIACGLNNLQKIADGEPLGGKSRPEDDFATDEDDDFLS